VSVWRPRGTPPALATDVGTINGRAWPFTERLDYRIGNDVQWRVVNLSYVSHAMHLHGMFFSITSAGDGLRSRTYPQDERPLSVTQYVPPGQTFDMLWRPERPGNWLFHCHMLQHMTPEDGDPLATHQHGDDASGGMAGLVVGIRITGEAPPATTSSVPPRRFTLRLREEANRYGDRPGYRVDAEGIEATRLSQGPCLDR